jgi:hypothetical protein
MEERGEDKLGRLAKLGRRRNEMEGFGGTSGFFFFSFLFFFNTQQAKQIQPK